MNCRAAAMLFENIMHRRAGRVERCGTGIANYVFIVTAAGERFVLRCKNDGGYYTAVYLLGKLSACGVPVPAVITSGEHGGFAYLILSCIPGDDLGNVYGGLDDDEKKRLAKDVIAVQRKEIRPNEAEYRKFLFYFLLYCVDFMGERGMRFLDKTVPGDAAAVKKLTVFSIFLWSIGSRPRIPLILCRKNVTIDMQISA